MYLEKVRAVFASHTDKKSFFSIVGNFYPPDSWQYKLIERAYDVAEREFVGVFRDGGERYFEHLRCVALIIMVYLRIRDPHIICSALLHDIIEDIKGWSYERLRAEFGQEIAEIVWWVTKPPIQNFGGSKTARNRRYRENLYHAIRAAVILKLADRLHNLLTSWETTAEKRERKILETVDFFLVLAERETILIYELEEIIDELRNGKKPGIVASKLGSQKRAVSKKLGTHKPSTYRR